MMKCVLALLFVSLSTFASYVEGDGQFETRPEDPLTLVNEQLKYNAFVDIITKELKNMRLNPELFWQKYEESFETSFERVDQGLKQTHSIDDDPSPAQQQSYQKERRVKHYKMLQKFGNLQSVIRSYSVKRNSRSSYNPKKRFIKLEARVDRQLLAKIYYQFVRGKQYSNYGKLYIDVDYDLEGIDFSELGVGNEQDFTQTVNEYWLKWFADNKPKNIESVGILSTDERRSLEAYLKLSYEEMLSRIPDDFRNSLYLQINLKIKRASSENRGQEYKLEYSGSMFLQDLQSTQYLGSYEFDVDNKTYRVDKATELGNIVANYIYRMPMKSFPQLNSVIQNIPPMSQIQRVGLYDYKSLGQVYQLMELVNGHGVKYSVKTQLESIGNNRAEMVVFYDGTPDQFKELMRGVESANSSLSFDFIDSDSVLGIKFNQVNEKAQDL